MQSSETTCTFVSWFDLKFELSMNRSLQLATVELRENGWQKCHATGHYKIERPVDGLGASRKLYLVSLMRFKSYRPFRSSWKETADAAWDEAYFQYLCAEAAVD